MKKVFSEIGSEEKLKVILTDFYSEMSKDSMLGFFFNGKDLSHIVEQQKNFLLKAMGITMEYKGKTPARAHEKLPPILPGHFDRRKVILRETLTRHGLSESAIETWLSFEELFRSHIVAPRDS